MTFSEQDLRQAFAESTTAVDRAATAEELLALLAGEGDDRQRLATLARAMATPESRAEFAMLRALHAAQEAVPAPRAGPTPAVMRQWALAAVVLVVAAVALSRWLPEPSSPVRGDTLLKVTLVEPQDGARWERTLVWRAIDGATYVAEVYSTDGVAIARRETADTSWQPTALRLTAGRYRWWVIAKLDDGTQVRSATGRFSVP